MTVKRRKSGSNQIRNKVKSRSLGRRLIGFLLTGISRFTLFIGDFFLRNPLLTAGSVAFAVTLGFVSANALWYQPQAHSGVFFQTRNSWDFKATPRSVLPKLSETNQEAAKEVENLEVQPDGASQPNIKNITDINDALNTDTLPALAANADVEIALIQQKLAALGIYNGNIDGLTGPQTRQAIEYWKQLQIKAGVEPSPTQAPDRDINIIAVPSQRPEEANRKLVSSAVVKPVVVVNEAEAVRIKPDQKTKLPMGSARPSTETKQISANQAHETPVTSQDIIRVQAGLKAFGNDSIVVDGVSRGATASAIKEFRRLFGLPVNGNIDADLMAKMREIGLIS